MSVLLWLCTVLVIALALLAADDVRRWWRGRSR